CTPHAALSASDDKAIFSTAAGPPTPIAPSARRAIARVLEARRGVPLMQVLDLEVKFKPRVPAEGL
ncbi:hypothetical protein, partial [Burkholderia multivorans]|uniref:hypothetical protein n=2 Tax=Burkholderia multivorans TaxID=87883 RepID=UPI001C65B434